MKTEQPDKIFREKLANFEKAAPANAWDRIEAGLGNTKNPGVPYWRIAAAVLVIGLVTYVLIGSQTETSAPIAEATKEKPVGPADISVPAPDTTGSGIVENRDAKIPESAPSKSTGNMKKNQPVTGEDVKRLPKPSDTNTGNTIAAREPDKATAPATIDMSEGIEKSDLKSNEVSLPENDIRDTYASQTASLGERESITLVMTADDTKVYLKKNADDGATSDSRKTSTLKRVLQKASELKSNDQDPFGDLRQMKNEILALNFKSEKQRGQKQMNQ